MKTLKRAAAVTAVTALALAAPFAASGVAESSAPAPIREAASVVGVQKAEAFWGPCRIPFLCGRGYPGGSKPGQGGGGGW